MLILSGLGILHYAPLMDVDATAQLLNTIQEYDRVPHFSSKGKLKITAILKG